MVFDGYLIGTAPMISVCTVQFVTDRRRWEAAAAQARPLRNDATMVIAYADLARFLAATGDVPRVIDVPAAREAR